MELSAEYYAALVDEKNDEITALKVQLAQAQERLAVAEGLLKEWIDKHHHIHTQDGVPCEVCDVLLASLVFNPTDPIVCPACAGVSAEHTCPSKPVGEDVVMIRRDELKATSWLTNLTVVVSALTGALQTYQMDGDEVGANEVYQATENLSVVIAALSHLKATLEGKEKPCSK